jgi:hypothetical protein
MDPKKAIATVRSARPGAVETSDQERFVLNLRPTSGRAQKQGDWFERLTGFRETTYEDTRAKLAVDGVRLGSLINGESYGIGELELATLQALRERVKSGAGPAGRLKAVVATGDVRQMHQLPENEGALFQVASQFNLLEMTSPSVTPEQGVTRYQHDRTQGPACAIACGAATIFRNYFAPVGDGSGQTASRQLDGIAGIGKALAHALGEPVQNLWDMRNGYALCSHRGLEAISKHLGVLERGEIDDLRGALAIGIHSDVEVTDTTGDRRPSVSQAFCSALPVAYTSVPSQLWERFASLILEAAYEATILASILNARRGKSRVALLTLLGGGAFGNRDEWIHAAMRRALKLGSGFDLEVRLVSYGKPSEALLQTAQEFS